jgi:hypothetical protein
MMGSDRSQAIFGSMIHTRYASVPQTLTRLSNNVLISRPRHHQKMGHTTRLFDGAPTMIRTWDPQIRNLVLYPTELPGQQ